MSVMKIYLLSVFFRAFAREKETKLVFFLKHGSIKANKDPKQESVLLKDGTENLINDGQKVRFSILQLILS